MIEIKHVPNILTGSRIIFSLGLLFVNPLSAEFFILYLLCGTTDVLDGYLARRTGIASSFGATFDSIADFIFFGIVLIVFIPLIQCPWWVLLWIGLIVSVRFTTLGVGYAKYQEISFLHTYANKATGAALFFFPFIDQLFGLKVTALLVCGAATFSALEELVITLTSKELKKDTRSFFVK
ncbi:CDP-alcohol phosphatidyltransferase [Syntrophobotulus glycolicus DSM 8271]|uniref:CDP-alcohol phosphatidyltransferase n=1 Tax=Syntrophobotulus glycolicus (strain DSM 8271 / FlGlyR) TaxID=645991 RepID=F0SX45_SYNGF|nr:CDP-alcohol phosphatidyltransferase family protein [Syntrophobotulus glycolicus]ADY55828.1 CDP-alcohol phosphatidyltransferase [Syntrophobotulus glycolicus DSM 8271]